jgi:hypothetical protein
MKNFTFIGKKALVLRLKSLMHFMGLAVLIFSQSYLVTFGAANQTISFTLSPSTKIYGAPSFAVSATATSGLPVTFTSSDPTVATCTGTNGTTVTILKAGFCDIRANQAGNGSYNPAPQVVQTLTITKKNITVTGAHVQSKSYSADTYAYITGATLSGVVSGDTVILGDQYEGIFAQTTIGTDIPVTTAMTISGPASGNYTLLQPVLTGNITMRGLTITGATVVSKAYDGNTRAVITGAILTGVFEGDHIWLVNDTTGTFAQATVGTGISVATAMELYGTRSENYYIHMPELTGNITAKELVVDSAAVSGKVYDGNTLAIITGAKLSGVVEGDDVLLDNDTTGTFAQAAVGTSISVATAMTVSGAAVDNYTLTQPVLKGNITAKALTVTNSAVTSKTYDGTTIAIITGATLSGVVEGDDVTLMHNSEGTFAQATVGTGITVTTAMTIAGNKSGNYTLTEQPSGLMGDILAAALTARAINKSKTYGNTNPSFTIAYTGFVNGENKEAITEPTIACSATATSNTGSYSISLSGGSATNYTLNLVNGSLTVNKAILTVTADDKSRGEGEANPAFTITYSGFKNGETKAVLDIIPEAACLADLASLPGDYDITVAGGKDGNYSFAYVKGTLTITPATGFTDATLAGYTVYPNPATDFIVIKNPNLSAIHVEVFNISGRLVIETIVRNDQVNIQSLAPGLYNLRIDGYAFKLVKK